MVLDFLKRLIGLESLSEHEKDVLRRKHRKLEKQRMAKRKQLHQRGAKGGKKQEDPVAKRLMHEISEIEKEQRDIEKRLGEDLGDEGPRSRRGRPR